jgi:alkylation response protein AidB-like acyl-CoA dehydrogenase
MDFELSDDQRALQEGISSLVAGAMPLDVLRQREGAANVVDAGWWQALDDAGVFSFLVPEAEGGVGLGLTEAIVVAEELGRGIVPGPIVSTMAVAPELATGLRGSAFGIIETPPPNPVIPMLLEHAQSVDGYVVLPPLGDAGGAVTLVSTNDLVLTAVEKPLDPLTPLFTVSSDLAGGVDLEGVSASELRQRAMVLIAATQVGIATATIEQATAYAKTREQFGRPIGSFQAIKHLLADGLCRTELARSALWAAAVMLDDPDVARSDADSLDASVSAVQWRAVAGAKLLADEAALANARTAIQVHGGMGFTWEVPIHLYLKRARVASTTLGTRSQLTDMISALI